MNFFSRMLTSLGEFWKSLSGARRAALVMAAVVLFAAAGVFVYLTSGGQYAVLASGIPLEESAAITTKLKAQNVPYKLEGGGTTIMVPEERLQEVRVALAAEGIPTKGGKGYEIFDDTPLGMTPFVQNVKLTQALQGEIERSISKIDGIQSAKVLIARPEPSPFVREQKPTTAAITITLKPNGTINRNTASGIITLVSRSVEGLRPENVTLMDSTGRRYVDPRLGDQQEGLASAQLEYRRDLENYLASKAEDMLRQHLGVGRAIVKVSADVDFSKLKQKETKYSPEDRAVVADRNTNSSSTSAGTARGPVGTPSNVSRSGGGGGGGGNSREETNSQDFLVSSTTRELERMGGLQRLSAAVMVDLSNEDGAKIINLADVQDIVKQAIGFQTKRGDEIKVSDVKLFTPLPLVEPEDQLSRIQRISAYVSLARNISFVVGIVVLFAMLGLLLLPRRKKEEVKPPQPDPVEVERQRQEELRKTEIDAFGELAKNDPDAVLRLLQMLLGQDQPQPATAT